MARWSQIRVRRGKQSIWSCQEAGVATATVETEAAVAQLSSLRWAALAAAQVVASLDNWRRRRDNRSICAHLATVQWLVIIIDEVGGLLVFHFFYSNAIIVAPSRWLLRIGE